MKILKIFNALSSFYDSQRVRIVLGHPSNNQYVEGSVKGFEGNGGYPDPNLYILLDNVTTNSHWLQDSIDRGVYSRIQICPNHRIEII